VNVYYNCYVQKTGGYSERSDGGGRKCLRALRSSLCTNCSFVVYCLVVAAVQGCIQSVLIFLPVRGSELGAGPRAAALLLTLFGAFFDIRRNARNALAYFLTHVCDATANNAKTKAASVRLGVDVWVRCDGWKPGFKVGKKCCKPVCLSVLYSVF